MLKWLLPWFYIAEVERENLQLAATIERREREITQFIRTLADRDKALEEQARAAAYYANKTPKRGKGGRFVSK
jgi:peptidoglycan hydrolase CwlO-like protein